jgi:hypothetical protein
VQPRRPRDSSPQRRPDIGGDRPCLPLYLVSGVSKDDKPVLAQDEIALSIALALGRQVVAAGAVELDNDALDDPRGVDGEPEQLM